MNLSARNCLPLFSLVGVPKELVFQTKPKLGWQLIKRTQERQIPFQAAVMDDLYGRNEILHQNFDRT